VAENCTIYSSRSSRPVQKLLDTPSYSMGWRFLFRVLRFPGSDTLTLNGGQEQCSWLIEDQFH